MPIEKTIEEVIQNKDLQYIYGEILGDIADDLSTKGGIVVFEISREDLLNDRGFYSDDSCKEIGNVKHGDWEGLKKIIGEEDTILEEEESKIYKEGLITEYEACDKCVKICECHNIGRALLYCEGHYIYSGTCHYKPL
jgi:hypothetical protein